MAKRKKVGQQPLEKTGKCNKDIIKKNNSNLVK
jgi:hypothetical protein